MYYSAVSTYNITDKVILKDIVHNNNVLHGTLYLTILYRMILRYNNRTGINKVMIYLIVFLSTSLQYRSAAL